MKNSRRKFLQMVAGAAGASAAANLLPGSIARALAIAPSTRHRSIEDVEHIVVFMQENRSFDHYFGSLRGVRGYNERFPIALPSGLPVWFQPRKEDAKAHILPFRLDTMTTSAQCVGDLDHSWKKTHAAIDNGVYDKWPANKTNMTMGHHVRDDIPFHYALADAFTICDNYFCSTPSQTHPNRLYLMSATLDPTGAHGGPAIDNNDIVDETQLPPFTWTTYPERLQEAGISWRIYQQGTNFDDDFNGNFGTNVLGNFKQFIDAKPGTPLHDRGMTARNLDLLAADVKANKLPQVSWVLPPAAYSEHPKFTPGYGADYTSRVLDALTSNPEVWSKTVLLLMYDENDGFFDHVVPPWPPMSRDQGLSTVSIEGEKHDFVNPRHEPLYTVDNQPYGLGPRVPMTVISPWSKGGFVCSQVFDHTSIIRFIETRFGVTEPNITPWRRAVCGDLTTAFDFEQADHRFPKLPNTAGYRAMVDEQCKTLAKPVAPQADAAPTIAAQEPGTRPARALPYALHAHGALEDFNGAFGITFANTGTQAGSYYAYASGEQPRRYTVEGGKSVHDRWHIASSGYDIAVHGPNGFYRRFAGKSSDGSGFAAKFGYDVKAQALTLELHNGTVRGVVATIADNAYGTGSCKVALAKGASVSHSWPIAKSGHWYDLTVATDASSSLWRAAGHMETGAPSISDPAATHPVTSFD